MRRSALVLPLTSLVALTTALALLLTATTLLPSPAPSAADPAMAVAADADVVERFYAGLNQALAHGDHVQLDAVLAPDVAIQLPGQPVGDRAALHAWLAGLRHAAPGTRVTLHDVLVGRDRAAARATADGDAPQIAGAAVLDAPVRWDASAFLQLRAGQVVGYAPIAAPAPLAVEWPPFPLPLPTEPGRLLLARLQLPDAHSRADVRLRSWQLLLGEAGVAAVDVAGPVQRVVAGSDGVRWQDVPRTERPIELRPGEAVLIPPDASLALHPADDGPAELLLLGDAPMVRDPAQRSRTSQGAVGGFAGSDGLLRLTNGALLAPVAAGVTPAGEATDATARVTVTRAMLPPGAALVPHPVVGVQLVAVEAGLLGVAVPAIGAESADPAGEVLIRDGYPLGRGTAPRLRNAGGTRLELVVVTFEPVMPRAAARATPI